MFWLLYDAVCRSLGRRKNGDAMVGALVAALVCLASWLACRWFAGRAAFLLVGAMLATAMSANVLFAIIPGQRALVAQIRAGRQPDPAHGLRGKQRSVHNTYFTLPVLFAMLGNHYSFVWSHAQNWLVLIVLMAAGAALRQYFVLRHGYKTGRGRNPWPYALAGVAVLLAAIVWLRPQAAPADATVSIATNTVNTSTSGQNDPASYAAVQAVLERRCYQCHGAQLQMKNLRLDQAASVRQHAQAIHQQVVAQRLMPLNNATAITDAERALIARWFEAGAPVP